MTQDEIIRMARKVAINGWHPERGEWFEFNHESLERFANLVAAKVGIEQHKRGYEAGLRDGAEATKEQLFKELMDMHRAANGQHNYYQYAVIQLRGEPA